MEKAGSGCVFKGFRRPEKQGSGLAFQDFLKQTTELSNTISKNKLEQLRTIVTRAHEKRFKTPLASYPARYIYFPC